MANNLKLNGLQPLPFKDIPAQLYLEKIDPIRANYSTIPYKNFQIGTFWLNTVSQNLWYLANLTLPPHIEGNWIQIGGGVGALLNITIPGPITIAPLGGIVTFTSNDSSIAITSSSSNNVNFGVVGGRAASSFVTSPATGTALPAAGVLTFAGIAGITVTAAGSTVTIAGSGGAGASSFPTDNLTAVPLAGVLNVVGVVGSNIATTAAVANTVGINLTGITQFNVQVGGASNALTQITPTANVGWVLTSNGLLADPTFQAPSPAGAVPTFQVILSAPIAGVTGNNANYIVKYDTPRYATGGFTYNAATGQATVPVDGIYHFSGQVYLSSISGSNPSLQFSLVNLTTGTGVPGPIFSPANVRDNNNRVAVEVNGDIYCPAASSVTVNILVTGPSANVGVDAFSQYSGFLVYAVTIP